MRQSRRGRRTPSFANGSPSEMQLKGSDMQAEALVLRQSILPRCDVRHRRSLKAEHEPSIDRSSGRDVSEGEAISCDVPLVREMGLKHIENLDRCDPSLLDLGRIALGFGQTHQLHDKRMK